MRFLKSILRSTGETFPQLVVRTVNYVLTQHEILTRASAIAFAAMMAFIPIIALVITLGAYMLPDLSHPSSTGIGNLSVQQVESALRALLPGQAYDVVARQIVRIQEKPPLALLSLGIIIALWTASNLFVEVIDALNRIYGVAESRSWWKLRITAIAMTLIECVILLASFVVITFWPQIVAIFGFTPEGATVATVVKWAAVVLMVLVSFALVFHMGPDAPQKRRWVTPGSIFGTIVFLGATYLFQLYVQNFAQYEVMYGSLAGVMMLLLWFWITSLVLLMAAEMNRLADLASERSSR